jgi:hypothetical protein
MTTQDNHVFAGVFLDHENEYFLATSGIRHLDTHDTQSDPSDSRKMEIEYG